MSVYRPVRKTDPARLERARRRAETIREENKDNTEWLEKRRSYMAEWNRQNKEQRRIYARDRARFFAVDDRLRRKGLDPSLKAVVEAHDGNCDICSGKQKGRWTSLDIDHDHQTGAYRGMLCGHCNRALGLFNDDPGLLRKAALYLEETKEIPVCDG